MRTGQAGSKEFQRFATGSGKLGLDETDLPRTSWDGRDPEDAQKDVLTGTKDNRQWIGNMDGLRPGMAIRDWDEDKVTES